jgi:hypothetical protein
MTSLEKLCRANRWRVKTGQMASDETYGWNGAFIVPLEGEMWHVILSDKMGWKHLSISNAQSRKLPSWTVMGRVKDAFFADDEWCCQFFPAKEEYVNDHPWCLHLWVSLDEPMPHPSVVLV